MVKLNVKNIKTQQTETFEVANLDVTVSDFSNKIAEHFNFDTGAKLIYAGKILKNEDSLEKAGVQEGVGYIVCMKSSEKNTSVKPVTESVTVTQHSTVSNIISNSNSNSKPIISEKTYKPNEVFATCLMMFQFVKQNKELSQMFNTNIQEMFNILKNKEFMSETGPFMTILQQATYVSQQLERNEDWKVAIPTVKLINCNTHSDKENTDNKDNTQNQSEQPNVSVQNILQNVREYVEQQNAPPPPQPIQPQEEDEEDEDYEDEEDEEDEDEEDEEEPEPILRINPQQIIIAQNQNLNQFIENFTNLLQPVMTEDDEANIQGIVAMGFPYEQAKQAYISCGRNQEFAINLILNGVNFA
jgi:hypothetical protein